AKLSDHRIRAATDAMGVGWFSLDDLPKLAFDHSEIVAIARERLRGKVRYAPVGFELLPPRFSLTQLQRLYEIILGTDLDKRNFRKKILSLDLIVETDEVEQGVRHRAARLSRFDRCKYDRLARPLRPGHARCRAAPRPRSLEDHPDLPEGHRRRTRQLQRVLRQRPHEGDRPRGVARRALDPPALHPRSRDRLLREVHGARCAPARLRRVPRRGRLPRRRAQARRWRARDRGDEGRG